MKLRSTAFVLVSLSALTVVGCGSNGMGGATGSGGGTGSGGAGGTSASGGSTGTGGTTGTGGRGGGAAGGATGTGGRMGGRGGATNTGDRGGAAGGANGTGGAGGAATANAMMNFFVSSHGPGQGGNLAGLAGADAFCKMLATAVSATLGAKTWHAYLSTATVNAHDRIGSGPWTNAAGVVIANNLTDLHDQIAATAALNATWPIGDTSIALDERGNQLPPTPLVHDILTGSNTDGTVLPGFTCNDWTSSATTDLAQIGHSNRTGGGRPPSWNSAHATTGCAEPTADMMVGTVSSGGGRGSIYCFAVP